MLKKSRFIIIILVLTFTLGCSKSFLQVNTLKDLSKSNVGVYTGSEYDLILEKTIKGATPSFYNSYTDQISALKSGKIDGFLTDEPLAKEILKKHSDLKILDEKLTEDSYAFAISPKLTDLQEEVNGIINEMKKDGTLAAFEEKWFSDEEGNKTLETYNYKGKKTIKFATVSGSAPFAYMQNNEIVGFDIEVINYIGYKLGYKIEIVEMAFEGVIPALVSGKVDMAGCSIIVTEERKKSVLFSESNYTGGIVIVTRK